MKQKPNQEIRTLIKKSNVYAWEVAEQLNCHENSLFRILRRELNDSEKERILRAIETVKKHSAEFRAN